MVQKVNAVLTCYCFDVSLYKIARLMLGIVLMEGKTLRYSIQILSVGHPIVAVRNTDTHSKDG